TSDNSPTFQRWGKAGTHKSRRDGRRRPKGASRHHHPGARTLVRGNCRTFLRSGFFVGGPLDLGGFCGLKSALRERGAVQMSCRPKSVVPSGLIHYRPSPNVSTLGYCRVSLRDVPALPAQILVASGEDKRTPLNRSRRARATAFVPGLTFCCVALFLALNSFAQEVQPPATLQELQEKLAAHVAQPRFASALWGVKIVSLDTGKTLFEHNPQKLFSPASNSKLYTVALALDRLGPDYRIKTSLFANSKPDAHGNLKGDLIVYGRGDPTINALVHGGDIYSALEPLVTALTHAGVRHFTGDLVGDESFFRGPPYGSGWAWDDLEYYYGAEVSALTINDNTLQVSVKPGESTGSVCKISIIPNTSYISISNWTHTA